MSGSRRLVGVGLGLALLLTGLTGPAAQAEVPAASWPRVNLAHLDWLRRDVRMPIGRSVATWQIYATPVKKGQRQGPYRFVGDEDEGVGCVDDVARAAIVYAREFARTRNAHAAKQAKDALMFVTTLAKGDGTYYNFIWADGRINHDGPTSKAGLNWWTARAVWALAEGATAFRKSDPRYADVLRAQALRTIDLLEADLAAKDGTYRGQGALRAPNWFMGEAPDVTAVAMLGLATLQLDRPDPRTKHLIARYGAAIAAWHPAPPGSLLDGAHLPSLGPSHWHAYGAHMLHALALGGRAIGSKALVAAARREADRFVPSLLVNGGPIAGLFPAPVPYAQIAYGLEPQVLGLLALEEATGERRYGKLAGLFGSWLTGNNPAKMPMYDPATGRIWDGIDLKGASHDAGAESTIEGLLTLQALARRPDLAPFGLARDTARHGVVFWDAEKTPGALKLATPGLSGDSAALLKPGASLLLSGRLTPGAYVVSPVVWRAKHVPGEAATLTLQTPQASRSLPIQWPTADARWPIPEELSAGVWTLPANPRFTLRHGGKTRQDLRVDGLALTPVVAYRVFRAPGRLVAVVVNHTGAPRRVQLPGIARAVDLVPYGTALIEAPESSRRE